MLEDVLALLVGNSEHHPRPQFVTPDQEFAAAAASHNAGVSGTAPATSTPPSAAASPGERTARSLARSGASRRRTANRRDQSILTSAPAG